MNQRRVTFADAQHGSRSDPREGHVTNNRPRGPQSSPSVNMVEPLTTSDSDEDYCISPPIRTHEVNLITLDHTPEKKKNPRQYHDKARINYLERKYKKCKDERDSLIKQQQSQERSWKNKIKIMKTAHSRQLEEVKTKVEGQEKGNTDQKNQYKETKKKEANKENKTDATAHKQELIWKEEEKEKSRQKKEEEDSEDDQQVDQYRKPTPQRPERTETRRCTPPPTLLLPTREHDVGSETMEPKDSTVHSARLEEEPSPEPDRDTPTSFCIPRRPAFITALTTLLTTVLQCLFGTTESAMEVPVGHSGGADLTKYTSVAQKEPLHMASRTLLGRSGKPHWGDIQAEPG